MIPKLELAAPSDGFATRVLKWFDLHGRHDLPWQRRADPYRIWVSEIMLQQTQVTTVIPYFERFMARFPTVDQLASARADDVLALWSGLGYYARARNLHDAARRICTDHGGVMPRDIDCLQALPGIGRSTAAAILAQAHGDRHAILDGNVKRVLARHAAVSGWPGRSAVGRRLWALAELHTPHDRVAAYTQAIMDLGATLCTRRQPRCPQCPVRGDCLARAQGRQHELPEPRPAKPVPVRNRLLLSVRSVDGGVLLERRPDSGVWGGLWSLPEVEDLDHARTWCRSRLGCDGDDPTTGSGFEHRFSHFLLRATTVEVTVSGPCGGVEEGDNLTWYHPGTGFAGGLPAPVARFLSQAGD
ncbi:MAG: A/G-specific adenine glycosylase [Gammaproteobacteria bacterium]